MFRIVYIALSLFAACGTGWRVDPAAPAPEVTKTPAVVQQNSNFMPEGSKLVFVTASTYVGNDVATHQDADEKCADAAEGAGLGRSFKAWLSEPTAQARAHIADVGPWYPPSCLKQRCFKDRYIFTNLASIKTAPANYLFEDQHGNHLLEDVWTASDADGTVGESCLKGEEATYGRLYGTDWSSSGTRDCAAKAALLCLQQ